MNEKIDRFEGEYRFLSNFYPAEVELNGDMYSSVEHAYQAAKTIDPNKRKVIREANTAGQAKRLGKYITLRVDWENIKLSVMEDLVRQKFTKHEELKKKLLQTDNKELIESNYWRDFFLGVCKGKGQNYLGKILMKIREEVKNEK